MWAATHSKWRLPAACCLPPFSRVTRHAATDGCTPELITGWHIALAATLLVPYGDITVRCTSALAAAVITKTTEKVILTCSIRCVRHLGLP